MQPRRILGPVSSNRVGLLHNFLQASQLAPASRRAVRLPLEWGADPHLQGRPPYPTLSTTLCSLRRLPVLYYHLLPELLLGLAIPAKDGEGSAQEVAVV